MPGVYIGTSELKAAYVGTTPVKEIYVGTTKVRPSGRLPAAYQEVEYIQSTGTQYIDTGYVPTSSFGLEVKYNITSKVNEYSCLVGSRTSSSRPPAKEFYIGWRNGSGKQGMVYIMAPNYNYNYETFGGTVGVDYNISYLNGVLSDGTNSVNASYTSLSTRNLYIFAINTGSTGEYSIAKLYKLKFYDSGTLVRDFVPCYRKSGTVIGLYDLVNNQFYTNAGTGTFTKGSDV